MKRNGIQSFKISKKTSLQNWLLFITAAWSRRWTLAKLARMHCSVFTVSYSECWIKWHRLKAQSTLYLEYHSVCSLVRTGIGTPPPHTPSSASESVPPPNQRGGYTRLQLREFERLEKKPSTLSTLWFKDSHKMRDGQNDLITIYAPVIYTRPCIMLIYITWGSWRGLGPGIPEFFGPCEMASSR